MIFMQFRQMERLDKINQEDFRPDFSDILNCYKRTMGVENVRFKYQNTDIEFFDPGGHRYERRKWFHVVDKANFIIFCISLTDYFKRCFEDEDSLRMEENLDQFGEVVNRSQLKNVPVFLLLTKPDKLEENLNIRPLLKYYPEYNGKGTFDTIL